MRKLILTTLAAVVAAVGASQVALADPPGGAACIYSAYPDSTADIAANTGGQGGVLGIQNMFNNARTAENGAAKNTASCNGTAVTLTANLVMPSQATWDGMTPSEQGLFLVNAERVARGMLPFQGIEENLRSSAQAYADFLVQTNQFDHNLDGNANSLAIESTPIGQRHQRWQLQSFGWNPGTFSDGSFGEDLAGGQTVAQAIYAFIYADLASSWGHRRPILTDKMVGAHNDFGVAGSEGFMAIGYATGHPMFGTVVVWRFFDPCGGGANACAGGTALPFTFRTAGDYENNGVTDIAVWRPGATGTWFVMKSGGGFIQQSWGTTGDVPVPGDYDGDGKTDIAVWRPGAIGTWFVSLSGGGSLQVNWGTTGDIPVQGDYDGDGKTDIAVWRPGATGVFFVRLSGGGLSQTSFGTTGDVPTPGDYDGDGKTDISVWRSGATGTWFVLKSGGGFSQTSFGTTGDVPAQADYDGDLKTDISVWRPGATGTWFIIRSAGGFTQSAFGTTGDVPAPGDYDADHKADISVWRPGGIGVWWVLRSGGGFTQTNFGTTGDQPQSR